MRQSINHGEPPHTKGNHKIRAVELATGLVSTVAGSGSPGSVAGIGTAASFNWPYSIALTIHGVAYIARHWRARNTR